MNHLVVEIYNGWVKDVQTLQLCSAELSGYRSRNIFDSKPIVFLQKLVRLTVKLRHIPIIHAKPLKYRTSRYDPNHETWENFSPRRPSTARSQANFQKTFPTHFLCSHILARARCSNIDCMYAFCHPSGWGGGGPASLSSTRCCRWKLCAEFLQQLH